MTEHLTKGLVSIVLLGVTAQWLASSLRLPSILILLLFGFIAGPITGLLDSEEIIGPLLNPIVSLSVALILFEGGLSLKLRELRRLGGVVRNLVTIGAVATWLLGTLAAIWFLGLYWKLSLLLGAILVVTGPTVIVPLLRHVRPSAKVGTVLRWEGIVIDSVGAILAVLTYEAIRHHHTGAEALGSFLRAFAAGGGVGFAGAGLLYLMLKNYLIPDFLQNAVSFMMVLAVFTISNMASEESGVLAVTVMGIALANQQAITVRHIVEFKENLQVLLIACLFIIVAASLDLDHLRRVFFESPSAAVWAEQTLERLRIPPESLPPLLLEDLPRAHVNAVTMGLFLAALIVIGRPVSVLVSTLRSDLNWRERVFLGFMAPRGIVAAAVSPVFASLVAEQSRLALWSIDPTTEPELFRDTLLLATQAELLVPITFAVIVATVSVYGIGAPLVARWLKVAQPNPQGALIVGAHPLARAIAGALTQAKCKVILADTNWTNWQEARMEGLPIYYGNIVTEYSIEEIELEGMGRLLALTSNDDVNSLAALHFLEVFGRKEVYQLAPASVEKPGNTAPRHLRGRYLFGQGITYDYLKRRWDAGARIKTTQLTEEFDFEDFKERYGESAVALFLVNERGRVTVFSSDVAALPQKGRLISLVDPVVEGAAAPAPAPPSPV